MSRMLRINEAWHPINPPPNNLKYLTLSVPVVEYFELESDILNKLKYPSISESSAVFGYAEVVAVLAASYKSIEGF